jgi:hypothetical protein
LRKEEVVEEHEELMRLEQVVMLVEVEVVVHMQTLFHKDWEEQVIKIIMLIFNHLVIMEG